MSELEECIYRMMQQVMTPEGAAEFIGRYNTLIRLVTDMRKAQKAYENAPRKTMEEIDALETYVFEMLEAEKKVDTYLKYMEEYK